MDCRLLPGSCMSSCDLVFVVHFVVRCIREIQPRKIIVHACLQLLHVLCACVSRVRSLSLYSFSLPLPLTLVSLLVRPLLSLLRLKSLLRHLRIPLLNSIYTAKQEAGGGRGEHITRPPHETAVDSRRPSRQGRRRHMRRHPPPAPHDHTHDASERTHNDPGHIKRRARSTHRVQ